MHTSENISDKPIVKQEQSLARKRKSKDEVKKAKGHQTKESSKNSKKSFEKRIKEGQKKKSRKNIRKSSNKRNKKGSSRWIKRNKSPLLRTDNCIDSTCYSKIMEWSNIMKNQVCNTIKRARRYLNYISKAGMFFFVNNLIVRKHIAV